MYFKYRRKIQQLDDSLIITGGSLLGKPVVPLDKVNFNKYPLKVKCTLANLPDALPKKDKSPKQIRQLKRFYHTKLNPQIYEFMYDHNYDLNSFLFSNKKLLEPRMFFKSRDMLESFVATFPDLVVSIAAPVDRQHLTDLGDPQVEFHRRDKPWYGNWVNKYEIMYGYAGERDIAERKSQMATAYNWLKQDDTPKRISRNEGFFPMITLFCAHQDYQHMVVQLRFLAPDFRLKHHKLIINDKIARDE